MVYQNNEKKPAYEVNRVGKTESIYSKRIRAGKRRTYFFDVRATRGSDYYLTITESRKRSDNKGYDRYKVFLYKEDFHKFIKALGEAVEYVKTELMPDFNFDAFNHDNQPDDAHLPEDESRLSSPAQDTNTKSCESEQRVVQPIINARSDEEVDKW